MAFTDIIFEAGKTVLTAEMLNSLVAELKDIENNLWKKLYPVGAILVTTKPDNPASYLGGQWQPYGQGRVLAFRGKGTDEEGNEKTLEAGETGGSYELAAHQHTIPTHKHNVKTASAGGHSHSVGNSVSNAASGSARKGAGSGSVSSSNAGAHTHTMTCDPSGEMITNNAGSGSEGNMPPYITAYAFRRVQ